MPYLLSERSSRWNPDALGAFIGLRLTTTKADICRSVMERVGYNLQVILDIFRQAVPIEQVIMIGGGAR
ncbi:MAG: FGGY-family carbohydrate kinase [Anaerolineae bacterium]